jgi:hypothetical protein
MQALVFNHVRELHSIQLRTITATFRRCTTGFEYKPEAFPGYIAPMIWPPRADAVPDDRACARAMFGMVPHWASQY